ncbi:MAG: hypothetical protein LBD50_00610 [Rickettsiales bacterium]|jgi:hypothetical protein|nr:hypothetical protein [Rickettsiales bacterium]
MNKIDVSKREKMAHQNIKKFTILEIKKLVEQFGSRFTGRWIGRRKSKIKNLI